MRAAGAFRETVEPELRVSKLYALNIATKVVTALADAGLLSLPDTEGVASLRASGTPVEAVADALKDMRLNLGPHALEAIHGGANHLVLTDAERHDIALTALKALGLEGP
jgi:hypothetical protein